jgi:hypothetical protein
MVLWLGGCTHQEAQCPKPGIGRMRSMHRAPFDAGIPQNKHKAGALSCGPSRADKTAAVGGGLPKALDAPVKIKKEAIT